VLAGHGPSSVVSLPGWQALAAAPCPRTLHRYTRRSAAAPAARALETSPFITLKEAAARFPLSYAQLRRLARTGRLEAVRFGHEWLTTPAAVTAYLTDTRLRSHDPHKYKRG
jgi:excisionase family DNA binding protein